MQFIIEHTRGPEGWAQAKMGPLASPSWHPEVKSWAQWMIDNGQDTVTVGDMMLQIVTKHELTYTIED